MTEHYIGDSGTIALPWNLAAIAEYPTPTDCGERQVEFYDADTGSPLDTTIFEDFRDVATGDNELRTSTTDLTLHGTVFNIYLIVTDVLYHNLVVNGVNLDRQEQSSTF